MKNVPTYTSPAFRLHKSSMITGAVLIGAGGLIGLIGAIVSGTALASAGRQWFRDLEVPPSEVVKHKWGQTKAATAAGSAAWQQHNGVHRAHV
jgi:hypothetical protein